MDGDTITEEAKERVFTELKMHFRPEFLNRVDDIVLFKPLSMNEVIRIVDKLVGDLQRRLEQRSITITLSDEAKRFIANAAYDPVFGARPLKRYIQKHVETALARQLIADGVSENRKASIDVKDDQLVVTIE